MSSRAALFVSGCGIGCVLFTNSLGSRASLMMATKELNKSTTEETRTNYPSYTHYGKNKQRPSKGQTSAIWVAFPCTWSAQGGFRIECNLEECSAFGLIVLLHAFGDVDSLRMICYDFLKFIRALKCFEFANACTWQWLSVIGIFWHRLRFATTIKRDSYTCTYFLPLCLARCAPLGVSRKLYHAKFMCRLNGALWMVFRKATRRLLSWT